MAARDSKTTPSNRTGKRPVEIERPFCPRGHGSMMMQATPQQSLHWERSRCTTTSGLDGCDVRLGWGSFEGVDAIIFFGWGGRDPVPLKVQGQLNFRGPGGCLQLVYETVQRPKERIPILGLVPRHRVESREELTESSCVPDVFFFIWMVPESQPTKSVVHLVIERKIVAMSPDRTPQSRTQRENPVYEECGDDTTVGGCIV